MKKNVFKEQTIRAGKNTSKAKTHLFSITQASTARSVSVLASVVTWV